MKSTRKITFIGLFVALALIIFIIEMQIPVLVPGIPGIKLGLANVISLTALILFGWKEALTIMFLRVLLGSFFTGNMASFMYSIAGGLISNIVMILLYKFGRKYISIPVISIGGAIFHNIGQLLVAAIIVNNIRIYFYLPVLLVSAVITGFFIGKLAEFLTRRLEKIIK